MERNINFKKYRDDHPDMLAVRKYESDIAALEVKYAAANEAHDWSMRNFYAAQLLAKRGNLKLLKEKMSKRFSGITFD